MTGNFEEALAVRDLAGEILKECESGNIIVSLELCIYLVDLKLLQLSKTVSVVTKDENLAEILVEKCVNDLKENPVWIETLKLQIFWRKKYRCRDEIKKIHHETIIQNVLPLMTEISEGSLVRTVDKEDLYRKIVIFVIMFAGLGVPTRASIVKETQAALNSIFKTTEIDNFLNLTKTTKEQQLIEFARLITGIKLFNKDCKKGGEGIDDLPLILSQGVQATKERLNNFKVQLGKRTEQLLKALLQVYSSREYEEGDISLPPGFKPEEVEEIQRLLVYLRQLELYLKKLIRDINVSFTTIERLVEMLQLTLLQVHDVVKYRVAIATVQVFPLFLQLSDIWVEMQEEVDILSEINNTFVDLSSITKLDKPSPLELSLCASSEAAALSDDSEISDESFEFYPGVKICPFSAVPDREHLQYEGFCAWTLAHTEGLLMNGNVEIGVLYFENRFYSFSSTEAAYKWAKDPENSITKVLKAAKAKPELLKVLHLYNDLKMAVEKEMAYQKGEKIKMENVAVQTELHPIKSYISRDYTFSEWELKRRALKLATLTRCVTKSQQTVKLSAFRTEIGIQVTPGKDSSTQTRRDGSCNHPTYPKFAWGLRTQPCDILPYGKITRP